MKRIENSEHGILFLHSTMSDPCKKKNLCKLRKVFKTMSHLFDINMRPMQYHMAKLGSNNLIPAINFKHLYEIATI